MESELIERKPCAKYTMAQHSRKGAPKAWRCRPSQVCAGGAALVRAALATALARGLEGDFERGAGLEGDLERADRLAGDLERAGDGTGSLRRVGIGAKFREGWQAAGACAVNLLPTHETRRL